MLQVGEHGDHKTGAHNHLANTSQYNIDLGISYERKHYTGCHEEGQTGQPLHSDRTAYTFDEAWAYDASKCETHDQIGLKNLGILRGESESICQVFRLDQGEEEAYHCKSQFKRYDKSAWPESLQAPVFKIRSRSDRTLFKV